MGRRTKDIFPEYYEWKKNDSYSAVKFKEIYKWNNNNNEGVDDPKTSLVFLDNSSVLYNETQNEMKKI